MVTFGTVFEKKKHMSGLVLKSNLGMYIRKETCSR